MTLDPVYRALFQALYKDAEAHGSEKCISASVALLERNRVAPDRGDILLRYAACTPEDTEYVLDEVFYRDMSGISFRAVDEGKFIHVPHVNAHSNVHFWNTQRSIDVVRRKIFVSISRCVLSMALWHFSVKDVNGSFVAVPLMDARRRVFGVLGVDTLNDPVNHCVFVSHELEFYQGVADVFSSAYHAVDARRKLIRVVESAIAWCRRRVSRVKRVAFYTVETDDRRDYVLRRMVTTDGNGFPVNVSQPTLRLQREHNLFRRYLFECIDNSVTVVASADGDRHVACPVRGTDGRTVAVLDVVVKQSGNKVTWSGSRDMRLVLKVIQQAYGEAMRESAGEDKRLAVDANREESARVEMLFYRTMLTEVRGEISVLDSTAYTELSAITSPPSVLIGIFRAVLSIFHHGLAGDGELDQWINIRLYVDSELGANVQTFDPTVADNISLISAARGCLNGELIIISFAGVDVDVHPTDVDKCSSSLARHFYDWLLTCTSLAELSSSVRRDMGDLTDTEDVLDREDVAERGEMASEEVVVEDGETSNREDITEEGDTGNKGDLTDTEEVAEKGETENKEEVAEKGETSNKEDVEEEGDIRNNGNITKGK